MQSYYLLQIKFDLIIFNLDLQRLTMCIEVKVGPIEEKLMKKFLNVIYK